MDDPPRPAAPTKNYAKQQRYAHAHERLKLALEHGFHIEAAAICESILSDRLHSHLHWRVEIARLHTLDELLEQLSRDRQFRSSPPRLSLHKSATFAVLIAAVRVNFDDLGHAQYTGLPARLDRWREPRNRITHNVTYTLPHRKTYDEDYEAFTELARRCAHDGQQLVHDVSNWDRAVRRRWRV